jgi:hypothetical protein
MSVEYKVVSAGTADKLAKEVNLILNSDENWKLGTLTVAPMHDALNPVMFYQTLVRATGQRQLLG